MLLLLLLKCSLTIQVKFNPQKCEVMRITHKQDKSKRPYHLSNAELKSVNSCKDLGVDVSRH